MIFWIICSITNLILLMRKLRFRKVGSLPSKQVNESNKAGLLINAQTSNTMLDYKVSTRKKKKLQTIHKTQLFSQNTCAFLEWWDVISALQSQFRGFF